MIVWTGHGWLVIALWVTLMVGVLNLRMVEPGSWATSTAFLFPAWAVAHALGCWLMGRFWLNRRLPPGILEMDTEAPAGHSFSFVRVEAGGIWGTLFILGIYLDGRL
jgi:hypothetical protein